MNTRDIDVAVIGGGPAGLAAAIKAKEAGLDNVLVIERGEYLGGLLDQCIHNGFGLFYFNDDLTGPEYGNRFIEKANDLGIQSLLRTMVVKILPDKRLAISNEDGYTFLSPKALVLAMGCRERTREALIIPGTRPAGVFTAGTAQRYVNVDGYIPGKEVVILGSGDIGMIMARRLTLEDARVKAVVEVLPYTGGLIRNEVQCLNDFDIPVFFEHTIIEVHGRERIEAVTIARVDKCGKPIAKTEQKLECDTLLISAGLIPENELSSMVGIELDPITGGPVIDHNMETSISGIFAGGNVVHVNDLVDNVTWEGEIAGTSAANYAMGKTSLIKPGISIKAGNNIRYVIPQTITVDEKVTLSLRVKEPSEKVRLNVGDILSMNLRVVKPSEMIKITISAEDSRKLDDINSELVVSCEKRS
jgi:NADPH-dependent 2,4-dienoyl-CoA reductase/sulfur reductase-like enzyme